MVENLRISFLQRSNKVNKKGFSVIRCRLYLNKNRKDFSTGLSCKPNHWDKENQIVLDEASNASYINNQLTLIKQQLEQTFLFLTVNAGNAGNVALDKLLKVYKGEKEAEYTILEAINKHQRMYEKLIGIDITRTSWEKYGQTRDHISGFVTTVYKKQDFPLKELKMKFLDDFSYYLKTNRSFKQSTVNKSIQRLRKMLKYALSEEMLDRDPFIMYKPKPYRKEIIYLDAEELELMTNHVFEQKRLQKVKDCFVFCCYTGLAFKELENLAAENIVRGYDGKDWIKITRQKTGRPLNIPLLPIASNILSKYNDPERNSLLPVISNQKFNSYLKEIASILGIQKPVSTHLGRRTFATTVLLYNSVPIEIVSKLLGHTNITITQKHYGAIIQKKVGEEMDRLSKKLDKD